MEEKSCNPFSVLYFTREVALADLQEFVRIKARELYRDAIYSNLEITGPVYWVYYGMDGNPQTLFTLEIAVPIADSENYTGDFKIRKLNPFKCISAMHAGSWDKLPETYGVIFRELTIRNHIPSGECREMYQHIDFFEAENNLTEVQVGIQ